MALGAIAAAGTGLELGTLCTPVTFRPAGVTAKAAATLSALTGGRAFVGIGAGWFEREHAAYGIAFPPARERLDDLERAVVTMKALWATGTKAYDDHGVVLPETTSYPRPAGPIPVVVGGSGERRTLRIAAQHGDACNLRTTDEGELARLVGVLHAHCDDVGRDRSEVAVTVLDLPVVGRRPRRRVGARREAPRAHAGSDVRRPHARRDRRRSPRPVGPARGAGRVDGLHRHPRPRRSRRRPRPSGLNA